MSETAELRVGYVPEHFSAPLFLAEAHKFYDEQKPAIKPVFVPFPSGTGHMIQSLKSSDIDVAVGLTEGWIAGLKGSLAADWYKLVGRYVDTPLCWSISVGADSAIKSVDELKGKKIGVSRIGSGSYVMSYVLSQQKGWLEPGQEPFEFVVCENFKNLRDAVNSGKADAFMWERFTTKKYYDSGEIREIGEIFTPWPSWMIAVRTSVLGDERLASFLEAVNKGIGYFNDNVEEGLEWIASNLDYTKDDANSWRKTCSFSSDVRKTDPKVAEKVVQILSSAGVVKNGTSTEGIFHGH